MLGVGFYLQTTRVRHNFLTARLLVLVSLVYYIARDSVIRAPGFKTLIKSSKLPTSEVAEPFLSSILLKLQSVMKDLLSPFTLSHAVLSPRDTVKPHGRSLVERIAKLGL